MRGSILKTAAATAAFAIVHSAFATERSKATAARWLGVRRSNGWYRLFYNAQAVVTFAALLAFVGAQPARTLYRVRGPLAGLMRLAQLGCLAYAGAAVLRVGIGPFSGFSSLFAWLTGRAIVPPAPEAQGPPVDDAGAVRPAGPFALSRQPLNFVLLPMLWLNPRMTDVLASFNVVTTAYAYLGSLHSERRLRRAYGDAYERYRASGVPFFVPRPGRVVHHRTPGRDVRLAAAPAEVGHA